MRRRVGMQIVGQRMRVGICRTVEGQTVEVADRRVVDLPARDDRGQLIADVRERQPAQPAWPISLRRITSRDEAHLAAGQRVDIEAPGPGAVS